MEHTGGEGAGVSETDGLLARNAGDYKGLIFVSSPNWQSNGELGVAVRARQPEEGSSRRISLDVAHREQSAAKSGGRGAIGVTATFTWAYTGLRHCGTFRIGGREGVHEGDEAPA